MVSNPPPGLLCFSVQSGIWCWYDTHGSGARVVFVFFFLSLSVNPAELDCDISLAGVFHYSRSSKHIV